MPLTRNPDLPQHSLLYGHYGELPLSGLPEGATTGDIFYYDSVAGWTIIPLSSVAGITTIVSSSVANPTVITTASQHALVSGVSVTILGHTGSTPSINGTHIATVVTPTTFTIPVNVTVGGTGGTVTGPTGLVNPMTDVADMIVGGTAGAPTALPVGLDDQILMVVAGLVSWEDIPGDIFTTLNFIIEGGGLVVTTGVKGDVVVDFDCEIESVTLLADVSGSIVVDIWNDTYANFAPTVADTITASAKPTITTATKSQDTTLTGWSTAIAAGETLRFNVDSVTTIQRVTLALKLRRT